MTTLKYFDDDARDGRTRQRRVHLILIVVTAAALLAGCAATGGGSGTSTVVKRAEARWEALLAGDFETAYQYYSPGYRSSHTRNDFELTMRLRKVQFRDVHFLEEQCEDDRCELKFEAEYSVASPVPGVDKWESKATIDETWIRTRDQWWYVAEDS